MDITSPGFPHEGPIPPEFAFARQDPETHFAFSENRNPQLNFSGVPNGCRSLVLIVSDSEAPTVADDVNKEGAVVPADLPRGEFHHWVMVDITLPAPASPPASAATA